MVKKQAKYVKNATKMSQKILGSEFLKLRDISQLRDISSKKWKWDGLLIGVLTVLKDLKNLSYRRQIVNH